MNNSSQTKPSVLVFMLAIVPLIMMATTCGNLYRNSLENQQKTGLYQQIRDQVVISDQPAQPIEGVLGVTAREVARTKCKGTDCAKVHVFQDSWVKFEYDSDADETWVIVARQEEPTMFWEEGEVCGFYASQTDDFFAIDNCGAEHEVTIFDTSQNQIASYSGFSMSSDSNQVCGTSALLFDMEWSDETQTTTTPNMYLYHDGEINTLNTNSALRFDQNCQVVSLYMGPVGDDALVCLNEVDQADCDQFIQVGGHTGTVTVAENEVLGFADFWVKGDDFYAEKWSLNPPGSILIDVQTGAALFSTPNIDISRFEPGIIIGEELCGNSITSPCWYSIFVQTSDGWQRIPVQSPEVPVQIVTADQTSGRYQVLMYNQHEGYAKLMEYQVAQ